MRPTPGPRAHLRTTEALATFTIIRRVTVRADGRGDWFGPASPIAGSNSPLAHRPMPIAGSYAVPQPDRCGSRGSVRAAHCRLADAVPEVQADWSSCQRARRAQTKRPRGPPNSMPGRADANEGALLVCAPR